jgi:two-component system, cell cycle sensor histidine kinase and response regulator CckA
VKAPLDGYGSEPRDVSHREFMEGMSEGAAAITPEGIVLFANPPFAALLQVPADRIKGGSLRPFFAPGEDMDTFESMLSGSEKGGFKKEIHLIRMDGTLVPVFLSSRTACVGGRQALCLLAVDLSELRRVDNETRISEEQARQSQKMEAVGRLASGVAHDFNNFLTAINGFSAFLLDMVDEKSPLRSGLLEISRAGERAATLTKQLLAFGRKQALVPQVVDVNSVVSDMHRMLARLIGEDVELVLNLDPKVGSVLFNPGQMEQIILNLSLNARDAMPKGGRLSVETRNVELDAMFAENPSQGGRDADEEPARPFVLLRFADNGSGMDEAVRDRIFEPFYTTKKIGRGSGLGLSTVYGIVKQSGGHIGIESERGKGTVFLVYLPRCEMKPKPNRVHKGNLWPARYRGWETVLVAEDEFSVRKMTRHLLEGNGYLVLEASDGMEALALIRAYPGPIHLLLTDVVMPNMNGNRLADEVALLHPGIRVIFMSGYTGDTMVRCGVEEGERAFLPKPFTPLALAQKVREILGAVEVDPVPVENGYEKA